jgi:primosomal protein N'
MAFDQGERGPLGPVFRVAVDAPAPDLYSYLGRPGVRVGQMVRVPLRGRETLGYVLAEEPPGVGRGYRLKSVLEVVVDEPLFGPDFAKLVEFVSGYYHYPPGLCVKEILPGGLGPKLAREVHVTERGLLAAEASVGPDDEAWRILVDHLPGPTPAAKLSRHRTALARLVKSENVVATKYQMIAAWGGAMLYPAYAAVAYGYLDSEISLV